MRIVLLLIAVLVPSYLLMCQRPTTEHSDEPGELIYQRPLERARGVEQQLRDDLDRRNQEVQQQLEGAPAPTGD